MSWPDDNLHDESAGDSPNAGEDPRLVEMLEEYQRELDAGRFPDRQAFVNRYPELADTINDCLEGLELLHSGIQRRGKNSLGVASRAWRPSVGRMANPLGDFQIVREIARGGMGIVYEAVQLSLGRRVALKVLPFAATLDSRQLQRFKNEAQAAALLHHTHIVPIYAVGCERGVHFYAMQLIEGQSLAAVIKQLRTAEGRNGKTIRSPRRAAHFERFEQHGDLAGERCRGRISADGSRAGGRPIDHRYVDRRHRRFGAHQRCLRPPCGPIDDPSRRGFGTRASNWRRTPRY